MKNEDPGRRGLLRLFGVDESAQAGDVQEGAAGSEVGVRDALGAAFARDQLPSRPPRSRHVQCPPQRRGRRL